MNNTKVINRLKVNSIVFFKYFLSVWGALSAFVSLVLTFVSWADVGITTFSHKLLLLFSLAIGSAIVSIFMIFIRNKKAIFGAADKGLLIQYGDIINLSFNNCGKSKKIIVIPTNRCFDLSCEKNLIAESSIHGQWIKKYISTNNSRAKVHQNIESILSAHNAEFSKVNIKDKKCGYTQRYAPGTIAELPGSNDVIFYLWGVSEFDSNLRANCSELDFFKALQSLIDYYDIHGQCVDLYCPVFGDHIIRPTKSTDDVLHFMISMFKLNRAKIHGNIHIVVYNQKKSDISILKYCD